MPIQGLKTVSDFADKWKWRDWVNDCNDKNLCCHCEKPILPNTPVNGLTGCHWDCYKKLEDLGNEAFAKMDSLLATVKAAVRDHQHKARVEDSSRLRPVRKGDKGSF